MKLHAFDFDGTLINSPMPETGKTIWKEKTGVDYPHNGWWSKPESLNTDVFEVKPYPNILNLLNSKYRDGNSMVIILTSRLEKLRSALENVLDVNNINVDEINLKRNNDDKGIRILKYLETYPEINEINVYDDSDKDIQSYLNILPNVPKNIIFNIYRASEGDLTLVKSNNNLSSVINEVVKKFIFNK